MRPAVFRRQPPAFDIQQLCQGLESADRVLHPDHRIRLWLELHVGTRQSSCRHRHQGLLTVPCVLSQKGRAWETALALPSFAYLRCMSTRMVNCRLPTSAWPASSTRSRMPTQGLFGAWRHYLTARGLSAALQTRRWAKASINSFCRTSRLAWNRRQSQNLTGVNGV